MAGRNHVAAPGEPTCGRFGCPRPAGFATKHPGQGPCRRHGGEDWYPERTEGAGSPPPWKTTGEASPYATLLRRLAASKRSDQPFPLAWADALYDALDGLPEREFRSWANVLFATKQSWRASYEGMRGPFLELQASAAAAKSLLSVRSPSDA